jgi:hypothetical protein
MNQELTLQQEDHVIESGIETLRQIKKDVVYFRGKIDGSNWGE